MIMLRNALMIWLVCLNATVALASGDKIELNSEQLESVLAIEADAEFGAYLVGECLTCHTPTGANGNIPQIHGKDKIYLASALLEYRNQQRENDVMRAITAALSDEELAAIVTYLGAQ